MKELDTLREIFVANTADDETREDNQRMIADWERTLIESQQFQDWKNHDITRMIIQRAKQAYKDCALALAENRDLDDEDRVSLWAKQDACLWLLSITDKDVKSTIKQIRSEIRHAISVT